MCIYVDVDSATISTSSTSYQICRGGISLAGQSPKARSLGGRGSDDDDDCDDYMTYGVLYEKVQLLLANCIFGIFLGFFLSTLSTN